MSRSYIEQNTVFDGSGLAMHIQGCIDGAVIYANDTVLFTSTSRNTMLLMVLAWPGFLLQ